MGKRLKNKIYLQPGEYAKVGESFRLDALYVVDVEVQLCRLGRYTSGNFGESGT